MFLYVTSNNSNVSQQTQTRVAFCAFLLCSVGFFFQNKARKGSFREHCGWKGPQLEAAIRYFGNATLCVRQVRDKPKADKPSVQTPRTGLLCEDFGIAKAAGGVWWCRLPAGCAAHSSHRCCSEPSCCRQRCPGAGTAPAPGRLEALLPRAYSSPWWPQAAPVSAGLPLPSTKP